MNKTQLAESVSVVGASDRKVLGSIPVGARWFDDGVLRSRVKILKEKVQRTL